MRTRRLYLASSWRNPHQPELVRQLREARYEVYDFRNPAPGDQGFSWKSCTDEAGASLGQPDADGKVQPANWRLLLDHPTARRGFQYDYTAMRLADAGVLLLPAGSSAHLEYGWLVGAGKPCVVYAPPLRALEPELMPLVANPEGSACDLIALTLSELLGLLRRVLG